MSQNEWKTTEIRASKVGNFSPFSCPGRFSHAVRKVPRGWGRGDAHADVWAAQPVEPYEADAALRAAAAAALAAVFGSLEPLLSRVDFLPANDDDDDDDDARWLVSEVDCFWCELFLRVAPPGTADRVAALLRDRALRGDSSSRKRRRLTS